ncbi:MAG TPA: MBL fold metallo-hydrolase, partial [Acidothermaceae bacterium]|nr:MBL fold metallo-hydrolase [Acidothermaceae bacterium]
MASYTGEVKVGGPAAVRDVPGIRITKVAVGPMDNNAYFLRCARTGDTLLIDAAAEPDRLLEARDDGLLISVVTTHQHPDHWQALEAVVGVTGPNVIAHRDDASGLPIPVTQT